MPGSLEVLIGGTWAHSLGTYGTVSDLTWTTRWGTGACGMYEASWTMPLPADYTNTLLRRGQLVEIHCSEWRIGSSLVLAEPVPGSGLDQPWQFTATGLGREVEGSPSWLALDATDAPAAVATTAVDQAIARGLQWAGRDATVPATVYGSASTTDQINSLGDLLSAIGNRDTLRWLVGRDNKVGYLADPTTPTWHIVPNTTALGTADDDYYTAVYVVYDDSATGKYERVKAPPSASATQTRFGRKELPLDQTALGPIAAATAQAIADGILAKYGGRLNWVGGMELTSQEILSAGGVPADLSMIEAGQMVRLHGEFPDLLETTGLTYVDIILGEVKWTAGAQSISMSPMGAAARDLASVIEASGGTNETSAA